MHTGHPSMDLWTVDLRRAMPLQGDPEYLRERVSESLGRLYAVHWPFYQFKTARNVRLTPFHERNPALGVRGVRRLLEHTEILRLQLRAILRAAAGTTETAVLVPFEHSAAEHRAVRENVGLFDQTPFA